ncbi:hypothetical protein FB451DRAFT_1444361 [Mycena latifolia]|nr:hypothetical protein FB451DRAFT_1444361 [Mycena latifolia]
MVPCTITPRFLFHPPSAHSDGEDPTASLDSSAECWEMASRELTMVLVPAIILLLPLVRSYFGLVPLLVLTGVVLCTVPEMHDGAVRAVLAACRQHLSNELPAIYDAFLQRLQRGCLPKVLDERLRVEGRPLEPDICDPMTVYIFGIAIVALVVALRARQTIIKMLVLGAMAGYTMSAGLLWATFRIIVAAPKLLRVTWGLAYDLVINILATGGLLAGWTFHCFYLLWRIWSRNLLPKASATVYWAALWLKSGTTAAVVLMDYTRYYAPTPSWSATSKRLGCIWILVLLLFRFTFFCYNWVVTANPGAPATLQPPQVPTSPQAPATAKLARRQRNQARRTRSNMSYLWNSVPTIIHDQPQPLYGYGVPSEFGISQLLQTVVADALLARPIPFTEYVPLHGSLYAGLPAAPIQEQDHVMPDASTSPQAANSSDSGSPSESISSGSSSDGSPPARSFSRRSLARWPLNPRALSPITEVVLRLDIGGIITRQLVVS